MPRARVRAKAAHRAAGVEKTPVERIEQNKTDRQGGQVGALNAVPGTAKAQPQGFRPGFARPPFLLDALEGENVGVHRHTDREQESGDTGKTERDGNLFVQRHGEDAIGDQAEISDQAGPAVEQNHKQDHQRDADEAGVHREIERLLAEGRPDGFLFHDLDRDRQRAGVELADQGFSLLQGEIAGNLGRAAQDGFVDHRQRCRLFIQEDRQRFADVSLGNLAEERRALAVEFDRNDRLARRTKLHGSAAQLRSAQAGGNKRVQR